MSHQLGHGMLTITEAGQTFARFAIQEGGNLVTEIAGRKIAFDLQRAPELEHFDIRKMSSADIARHLAAKLAEEESDREQDALERSFHD